MWEYDRSTGLLYRDGAQVGEGYAGNGAGRNDPSLSNVKDVGPLPAGTYVIGNFGDRPVVGAFAAPLTPLPTNEMFGRSGFFMHGDNPEANHSASDGCIVMSREVRQLVNASGCRTLVVI
jgi:hypothetical protein